LLVLSAPLVFLVALVCLVFLVFLVCQGVRCLAQVLEAQLVACSGQVQLGFEAL
jgi:hypothetical protein